MGEQSRILNKAVPLPKVTEQNADKRIAKATIILKSKPASRVKPIIKKDDEKKKDENKIDIPQKNVNIRPSLDLEQSEENSLYVSALEDMTESVKNGLKFINKVSNTTFSMLLCTYYAHYLKQETKPFAINLRLICLKK